MKLLDFVRLLRPQFLIAGFALNMLGVAVALHLGAVMDWAKIATLQVVVSSSQIAGACANEYADIASDRLNKNRTWFSGGSGTISSGRVQAKVAVYTMLFWTVLAFASSSTLAFLMHGGIDSFLLMALGISLALAYSRKPLMLSYRGFGEVAMAFMVSFLTPAVSFYLLYGAFHELIVWVTLPIVLQLFGLMMVVEYPDRDADLAAGKRNLVVRLGAGTSWNLGVLALALGGVVGLLGGLLGLPSGTALLSGGVLLGEALAFWILGTVRETRSRLFWSTATSCGFYVLLILLMTVTISRIW